MNLRLVLTWFTLGFSVIAIQLSGDPYAPLVGFADRLRCEIREPGFSNAGNSESPRSG